MVSTDLKGSLGIPGPAVGTAEEAVDYRKLTWRFPGKQEGCNAAQVEYLLRIHTQIEPSKVMAVNNSDITFIHYQEWCREQRRRRLSQGSRTPA